MLNTRTPGIRRDNLLAIKNLILTPETWTQYVYARDINQFQVDPADKNAVQFCISGAIMHVVCDCRSTGFHHTCAYYDTFRFLQEAAGDLFDTPLLTTINDRMGFKAVHRVLDKAIEEAN